MNLENIQIFDIRRTSSQFQGRSFPLTIGSDEVFTLKTDDGCTHMMTDFAPAARNAAKKIWGEPNFTWGMCAEHVSGRWFDKHKKLFKNEARNKRRMKEDFMKYKNCPIFLLASQGILFEKMMEKWTNDYGEGRLVEKFKESWSQVPCTRVVINHEALVRGGMPADNNALESTNKWHKYFARHVRYDGESYPHELVKWIYHKSVNDVSFGAHLNPVCVSLIPCVNDVNFSGIEATRIDMTRQCGEVGKFEHKCGNLES